MKTFDANFLIEWAKFKGISISIKFWEASGEYEIETHSPAKNEEFYMKRCSSEHLFIKSWEENLNNDLG